MNWVDWTIVIVPVSVIIGLAWYARRYARSVVDFLAAGRVAGRYVISVGDLMAGLSVITLVAGTEQHYQTGYGVAFWNLVMVPLGIVMSLTGYCTYRWRETRCLSKGQFIELRYGSKVFRVVTAAISTIAEMVTNSIGPAIAANFFIYYLGLPHKIMICGINLPCYVIIVTLCLTLAMLIIWPAGRISLLITDCCQGLISYPIFVIITGFVILKFSWDVDISPVLWDRVPGESFINPYDISKLRDFNVFAIMVNIFSGIMNRASWIGNDTSNSGRTPHEQKMASILGAWRNGFSMVLIVIVAILTIAFMNSGNFATKGQHNSFGVSNNEIRKSLSAKVLEEAVADPALRAKAIAQVNALPDVEHKIGVSPKFSQKQNLDTAYFETVQTALGDTPEGRMEFQKYRSLFQQQMMASVLGKILPHGVLGLFCLLMIMLLISTDDSRIFNASGCLVQDIILPFCKGQLNPKTHLLLLRLSSLAVSVFFFFVALLFTQMDYIIMFTTIMCAFWLGGAGPIMIFGLYSRFGNLVGAWCAIIFGSGTSLLGLIFQRNWALTIYPFLERHNWVEPVDRFLRACSAPFEPWVHWQMDSVKFPINSYEIFFISMVLAIGTYVLGSYLTYKPYDLDKLLHRGKYSDGHEVERTKLTLRSIIGKLVGITPEYTVGDKIIAWSVFGYSFVYTFLGTFVMVVVWNMISPWPSAWWDKYYFLTTLLIPMIIGIITTVWFLWGGLRDSRQLFIDLEKRVEDISDNGQVGIEKE